MAKMKMNISGQVVEVETMGFKALEEPWSLYRLDDGTVVKMKLVVSDVLKLPSVDPVTGLSQYMVRSSNVVSVEPPTAKGEVH